MGGSTRGMPEHPAIQADALMSLLMRRPGRLTLHDHAQNAINPRLVALAMALQPIEYVRIQTDRQLLFRRRPGHRGLLEECLVEPRNVRVVDLGILHTINSCQVAGFLADDRFFAHVDYPFSWR